MSFHTLEPHDFAARLGGWLSTPGPDSDVVVSCRVRLARNLEGYPFMVRLDERRAVELAGRLRAGLEGLTLDGSQPIWVDIPEAPKLVRLLLRERHLVSRELAPVEEDRAVPAGRAVVFGVAETTAAMVNEEDHLRLQGIAGGFDLGLAWSRVRELDQSLEASVDFACSRRLGYLTACPTNVGTGMRASVMLHLPALGLVRSELEKVFAAAQRTGLAVRGMYGEGSRAVGDYYQISNQVTLGRSEEDLISDLQNLVPCIVDFERRVRATLLEKRAEALTDRVGRSLGLLRSGRSLPTETALAHLSSLRLGRTLNLFGAFDLPELNSITVHIQRGHIQAIRDASGQDDLLTADARDRLRAKLLLKRFMDAARRGKDIGSPGAGPNNTDSGAPDSKRHNPKDDGEVNP